MDMRIKPVRIELGDGEVTDPICLIHVISLKNADEIDDKTRAHDLLHFAQDCMTLLRPNDGASIFSNLAARTWYSEGIEGTVEEAASLDLILSGFEWGKNFEEAESNDASKALIKALIKRILALTEESEPLVLDKLQHRRLDDEGQKIWRSMECRWVPDEACEGGYIMVIDKNVSELVHAFDALEGEKYCNEALMYQILPSSFCDMVIQQENWPRGIQHKSTCLMVIGIDGFRQISEKCPPVDVLTTLHKVHEILDNLLVGLPGLAKVGSSGHMYNVCGGLMYDGCKPAEEFSLQETTARMLKLARAMIESVRAVKSPLTRKEMKIKVAVHVADFSSGSVGSTLVRVMLFGKEVEVAKMMLETARGSEVLCTREVVSAVGNDPEFEFSDVMCLHVPDVWGDLQCFSCTMALSEPERVGTPMSAIITTLSAHDVQNSPSGSSISSEMTAARDDFDGLILQRKMSLGEECMQLRSPIAQIAGRLKSNAVLQTRRGSKFFAEERSTFTESKYLRSSYASTVSHSPM